MAGFYVSHNALRQASKFTFRKVDIDKIEDSKVLENSN